MSFIRRTNRWMLNAQSLLEMEHSAGQSHQQSALEAAIAQAIENTLVALVLEVLEVDENSTANFNLEKIVNSNKEPFVHHWLVKQLKEQHQTPGHWLNQWWLVKKSTFQLGSDLGVRSEIDLIEQNASQLIPVKSQSLAASWVEQCEQLVAHARGLNSYE